MDNFAAINMLNFNSQDTILALSTAPGAGAIAVIRISGPQAIEVLRDSFALKSGKFPAIKNTLTPQVFFGDLKSATGLIDEVLITCFHAPRSYTGQNVVEISCHGSPYIQQQVLNHFLNTGLRMAEPGEFTLRAFLNGKMDLSQAEAVADLIASDNAAAHQLALRQMRGGFSTTIKELREELIHFASLIELELDFAEEDVQFANRDQLLATVKKLKNIIDKLVASFDLGNVIRNGIPVVIAGKPNVGKSTLLNALLNEERAIVSEIAGTTRDTIEEELVLDGVKFRFIDTAGIRETNNVIEKIGVNKTLEKIQQSTLVLYMVDAREITPAALKEELAKIHSGSETPINVIALINKIDGLALHELEKEFATIEDKLFISARERIHLDQLTGLLSSQVRSGALFSETTIVSNVRHATALKKTGEALERVRTGIENGISQDYIAGDLRIALHYLGEITGTISTEDLLDNIFSKFCIGK